MGTDVDIVKATGRRVDAGGYVHLRIDGRDIYEHRHVWEMAHGPIPDGYHIHHRNHVRDDNRLENLRMLDGRAHNRKHTTERHRTGDLDNRGAKSPRYRSDLNDDDLVSMREAGLSFREIGRRLNAPHNVVANHYRRHLLGQGNR